VLRHEVKDVGYFLPRESSTSCQGNGIEPDLCNLIVSFHVNVWRFVAVTRVEEKSVRPMRAIVGTQPAYDITSERSIVRYCRDPSRLRHVCAAG